MIRPASIVLPKTHFVGEDGPPAHLEEDAPCRLQLVGVGDDPDPPPHFRQVAGGEKLRRSPDEGELSRLLEEPVPLGPGKRGLFQELASSSRRVRRVLDRDRAPWIQCSSLSCSWGGGRKRPMAPEPMIGTVMGKVLIGHVDPGLTMELACGRAGPFRSRGYLPAG